MEGMSKEQFMRKYIDTHKGIHCFSDLKNRSFKNSSLIKDSPGDKNIGERGKIPGKNIIESKCMEDRAEDKQHYIMDAVEVRGAEILDKEAMPFDKLLNSMIKIMPQKIEQKTVNFTFADMIKQATMDEEAEKNTIDIQNKEE